MVIPHLAGAETDLVSLRWDYPPANWEEFQARLEADRATLYARAAKAPDRAQLLDANNRYISSQRSKLMIGAYDFIPYPGPSGRLLKADQDALALFDLDDDSTLTPDEIQRSLIALSQ